MLALLGIDSSKLGLVSLKKNMLGALLRVVEDVVGTRSSLLGIVEGVM